MQRTISNWAISTRFNLLLINTVRQVRHGAKKKKKMQSSKPLGVWVMYTKVSLKCFALLPALLSPHLLFARFLRCSLLLQVFLQLFLSILAAPQPFKAFPAQCGASFQECVSSQMLPHPQLPLSFLNSFLSDVSTTDNTVATFVPPKKHLHVVIYLKEQEKCSVLFSLWCITTVATTRNDERLL